MVDEPKMRDSGERRIFSTGAQRDRGTFKPRPDLISPHANLREGAWMAKGAEKYGLRNYEKGIPISECVASLCRHVEDYKLGLQDEDHAAAIRTNASFIIHFEEEIKAGRMDPAIDDMPKYAQQPVRDCDNFGCGESILCPECSVDTIPSDRRIVHVPQEDDETPTYYIAGPMRGYRFFNFPAFDRARDRGLRMEFKIISPADIDRANGIDPMKWSAKMIAWYDAHNWTELHPDHQQDSEWLRNIVTRDVQTIIKLKPERKDGLALLPDWRESTGGTAEVFLARWLDLEFVDARTFRSKDIWWKEE